MTTLLFTIALVALIMLAMAIGVIVSGKHLRGSCGGGGGAGCHCRAHGVDPGACELPDEPSDPQAA